MADERMVPLSKPGELVNIAVTPADFFKAKVVRKDGAPIDARAGGEHFETYASAGYRLGDYYESKEEYTGPKTLRQYERQEEERRAARSAARTESPKAAEVPKSEAKKES